MKDKEVIKFEHECRMKEIEAKKLAELEVERTRHENQKELQRLREAGISHTLERKKWENVYK
jgi:hypothetical protein